MNVADREEPPRRGLAYVDVSYDDARGQTRRLRVPGYMEDGHDDEPHCYYVKTRDGARLIGKFFFSDGERAVRIEMYENDDLFEGVAAQFGVVVKTDSPTREVPVGAARLTRFERAALLVLLLFALAMMVVLLALGLRDPRGFWEWFRSLDTV